MDFLKIFDKKAEEKNWLNFLLSLLDFLLWEGLKWTPNTDDKIQDTYSVIIPEEGVNGGLKLIISIIKDVDIHCAISAEHHENINITVVYFIMEETKTELYGFYRHDKNIEAIITGEENKLVKSKFKDLHDKLINLRTK